MVPYVLSTSSYILYGNNNFEWLFLTVHNSQQTMKLQINHLNYGKHCQVHEQQCFLTLHNVLLTPPCTNPSLTHHHTKVRSTTTHCSAHFNTVLYQNLIMVKNAGIWKHALHNMPSFWFAVLSVLFFTYQESRVTVCIPIWRQEIQIHTDDFYIMAI